MISVMGEAEREVLVRDLQVLVRLGPRLGDLVVPSVAASGSNAGVCASVPGPRSPVREHPFAVEHECWLLLKQIVGAVCSAGGLAAPRPRRPGPVSVSELAGWLLDHVEDVAGHEQAADGAVVIGEQARRVADLVDPPISEREQLRARGVEIRDPMLSWGTERAVVEGAGVRGHQVSGRTVRRWADAGAVRSLSVPGKPRKYSFDDVLSMCAGKDERVAEIQSVATPPESS